MINVGCLSLSYRDAFDAGAMDLRAFLSCASDMRLDGVDLHFSHFATTDGDYLRGVRRECLRRGLSIRNIGASNNFGKRGDDLRNDIAHVKKWIDVAAQMGVPMVRIFAAWVPRDEGHEEAVWERMLAATREVAEHGEQRDVVVAVQNHDHGCITRHGQDVLRILNAVRSTHVGHVLDTGQYVGSPGASGARKGEPASDQLYDSIAATAPYALHVRAKFYRVSSGREEWLDYPRILDILNGVGYNGWVSVVYEGWDVEPSLSAVPKAVTYLRSLLRERDM
jgi:sugar phosphate isomerase/epimerase